MDIEAIRIELDLTPTEFAERLGVSKGHASDLRSGRRKVSLPVAAKLAKLTGRKSLLSNVVKERVAP